MFGGLAFLLQGNMCVGVHGGDLMVRVDPAETETLLREPGAKPFTLSGRPAAAGWLLVAAEGYESDAGLKRWVSRCVGYVSGLPAKRAAKR